MFLKSVVYFLCILLIHFKNCIRHCCGVSVFGPSTTEPPCFGAVNFYPESHCLPYSRFMPNKHRGLSQTDPCDNALPYIQARWGSRATSGILEMQSPQNQEHRNWHLEGKQQGKLLHSRKAPSPDFSLLKLTKDELLFQDSAWQNCYSSTSINSTFKKVLSSTIVTRLHI